jgi:hypothetical protein
MLVEDIENIASIRVSPRKEALKQEKGKRPQVPTRG